jgi:tRNA(Ile)-lysidine synthase
MIKVESLPTPAAKLTDGYVLVDRHLKIRTVPSPIGTFLLSGHNLTTIRDNTVRSAMIVRIMRYVSFQPWGSVRADGNRRVSSIQRIVDTVWAPDPQAANIRHFVAGGGVLWSPVIIHSNPSGIDKILIPIDNISGIKLGAGDRFGWLASRQPPFHKNTRAMGDAPDPLTLDLTDKICQRRKELKEGTQTDQTAGRTLEILYDCRFLLRLDLAKMPLAIATSLAVGRSKIVVKSRTRWYWPHIMWERTLGRSVNLAVTQDEVEWQGGGFAKPPKGNNSDWITMDWIRTLDAT